MQNYEKKLTLGTGIKLKSRQEDSLPGFAMMNSG